MSILPQAILDQIVQALAKAVWERPELAHLREPIESTLKADTFKTLTTTAFQTFADGSAAQLPQFFDAGFITMPAVQEALSAYLVKGETADLDRLAELYTKRHLKPSDAPNVRTHLQGYLQQVRETFATDPTYGPILLARDVQSMTAALSNLRGEMHSGFEAVISRLDALLQEPEIKALVERKTGTHIFLSYSRQNLAIALQIRNALEDAGHTIWQDTTAIKGGAEWIDSIEDGIKRAYAVVTVLSAESLASKWVKLEFLEAQRRGKLVIPMRVDSCEIPMMMLDINVIHGHPDLNAGIAHLLGTLSKPAAFEISTPKTVDTRQLEIDYLDRILLEHSVWQTVYTPMAGVARIRQGTHKREIKRAAANIQPMFSSLRQNIAETFAEQPPIIEQAFEDITEAVNRVKHLVVLGDPGAGKTTTLWKLAADYAQAAKDNPTAPLPVLLKLGSLPAEISVRQQIQSQLGALSLDTLLTQKRLALLVDALNELPAERRIQKVDEVRELVEHAQQHDLIAVVTCREQDYQNELDLNIQERVEITPLDPARIRQFCINHLPEEGEQLFWHLVADEKIERFWSAWQAESKGDFVSLWVSDEICSRTSGDEDRAMQELRESMRGEERSRSMLALARNPYMLFMITEVYGETGTLPQNRGKLFELFTRYLLLEREKLPQIVADELQTKLAELAYRMQAEGLGTAIPRDAALKGLTEEQIYRAVSANLLDGVDTLRFTHQLLQEYFAAKRLDAELKSPAARFWPPDHWWQPGGWEETAILLAGLYSDDTTPVLEWLRDANPELAARCVLESGAFTPPAALENLRLRWLPRLTNLKSDPQTHARAAVGRAVAMLKLDNRKGVGLREDGLPDMVWREVPGNPGDTFIFGEDDKTQKLPLDYPYWMAHYPVTYAQYEAFVADNGYPNREWWTEAGWKWKGDKNQPIYWNNPQWHISNHPVVGVSWYEAYAFCQWLTGKLRPELPDGWIIQLPTEAEWEKAARYPDGRAYPWGDKFEAERCNTDEGGLNRTSPVGIFPNGENPELHIHDLSGNVWEWCLSKYSGDYHYPEDNDPAGEAGRVVRGGSFDLNLGFARAASRDSYHPGFRSFGFGFRVVCRPPSP